MRGTEPLDEDAEDERRLTERRVFRERQEENRPRLRPLIRQAYDRAADSEWSDLLARHEEPRLDLRQDTGLLEAATPETYLAVREDDLPHSR
ncbi:hypothetical protein ACFY71_29420 [Streptomyces cinerochromogenes]|uniref:hypothetical protein n=1 Tax=Streptomyces cinerochromogenes TaxID=66422 RepID=UPI0036808C3D